MGSPSTSVASSERLSASDIAHQEHLAEQAARCRRLADSIGDAQVAETLRALAGEYELQASRTRQFA